MPVRDIKHNYHMIIIKKDGEKIIYRNLNWQRLINKHNKINNYRDKTICFRSRDTVSIVYK